jgi:hypothetical protein
LQISRRTLKHRSCLIAHANETLFKTSSAVSWEIIAGLKKLHGAQNLDFKGRQLQITHLSAKFA